MIIRKLCFLMLKCIDVHEDGSRYYFRKDVGQFKIPHVVVKKDGRLKKLSKKDCESYLNSVEGHDGVGFIAKNMTESEEIEWNQIYSQLGDKRHFEKISIPCSARINRLKEKGIDISRCF